MYFILLIVCYLFYVTRKVCGGILQSYWLSCLFLQMTILRVCIALWLWMMTHTRHLCMLSRTTTGTRCTSMICRFGVSLHCFCVVFNVTNAISIWYSMILCSFYTILDIPSNDVMFKYNTIELGMRAKLIKPLLCWFYFI